MNRQLAISNIKHLRELRGWSQDDLGNAAGVTQGYIGHIECLRRKGTLETWQSIAKALDVDLTALISDDLTQTQAEVVA
jgi:transcriptional regulator with XRE-family HTH domain